MADSTALLDKVASARSAIPRNPSIQTTSPYASGSASRDTPARRTSVSPHYVQKPTTMECMRESSNFIYGGIFLSMVAVVVVLAVLLTNANAKINK
eukprot:COSAG01_NODE_24650_length_771_cov_1812.909226_1_plen_95_part_10